jgi:hypothetical protein
MPARPYRCSTTSIRLPIGIGAEIYGVAKGNPWAIAILSIVVGFFALVIVFWAIQKSRGKI